MISETLDTTMSDHIIVGVFIYTLSLSIKVISSNYKLLVNKLLIMCIFLEFINAILWLGTDWAFYYFSSPNLAHVFLEINIITGLSFLLCLTTVLHLRNIILITNANIKIIEKGIYFLIILLIIGSVVAGFVAETFDPMLMKPSPLIIINTAFYQAVYISMILFSILSSFYLLAYYQEYYFGSKSIMKYLQYQMVYRRNWVIFVIICEILSISFFITTLLKVIVFTSIVAPHVVFLFELNTMIDFVKFDTVRSEITIGDYTIYMLEETRDNEK